MTPTPSSGVDVTLSIPGLGSVVQVRVGEGTAKTAIDMAERVAKSAISSTAQVAERIATLATASAASLGAAHTINRVVDLSHDAVRLGARVLLG